MSAWSDDALFVGRRIVERLQANMPQLREVALIDELDGRATTPLQTPSAVVMLHAMRPKTATEAVDRLPLEQDWLVMLAVRAVAPGPDRTANAIGPLIPPCVAALQGWKPEGALRALAWVPGLRPDYGRDTSYYPLLFRVQLVTT